jgi:lysine 2,3-aminomutase
MRDLMRALLRIKVRPYYLFHCDPVISAGHFRTSVWKGLEIMEGLRGHLSGLGIPTYVVDSPHGGGKIPLMPNYLVSASDDAVILRNYEGMLIRYQAEDKPATAKPTRTRGVSELLQGSKTALVPENMDRMKRRRLIVLNNNAHEANGHDLNGNDHAGHALNGHHGCDHDTVRTAAFRFQVSVPDADADDTALEMEEAEPHACNPNPEEVVIG